MIVVADTGPINYLILIGEVDVLEILYTRVAIPSAVAGELGAPKAPAIVRAWLANAPEWLEVAPNAEMGLVTARLDHGERAAIALAVSLSARRVLIDDLYGRAEAERFSLKVTGTLGILAAAHRRGLLDFEVAIEKLSRTNFYLPLQLLAVARSLVE